MATKRVSEKNVVISNNVSAAPARRKPSSKRSPHTPAIDAPVAAPVSSVMEITHEAVAELAYSYWVARGCQGGSPEEDWLRAEQELRSYAVSK
jgi:hypothetical protein